MSKPSASTYLTQWEYKDFVYDFPSGSMWAKIGEGAYSEAGAKLEFWQNYQRTISSELQKWIDDGWQKVGQVDSGCIEVRHFRGHKDKSCMYWALFTFFSIPSFGLLLLVALIMQSNFVEPVRFVAQMRRPI